MSFELRICSGPHEVGRPHELAGLGALAERGLHRVLGDPEVEDLDDLFVVAAGHEDVRRLEIAVDEPGLVRPPQAARDLREDRRGDREREPALALEALAHVLALEELHHDVRVVVLHPVVVDLDDVRALQARRCLGLALEALPPHRQRGVGGIHELDRHQRVELRVLRGPQGAHPADRQTLLEAIPACDDGARGDVHDGAILADVALRVRLGHYRTRCPCDTTRTRAAGPTSWKSLR